MDFTETDTAAIRAIAESVNAQYGSAGWMIGIYDPLRGDIELSGGNTAPDLTVRIGSVTKSMTAVAVLRLVDDGLLRLEDSVEQYVPGLPNGSEITVRMLLDMTAGLPDFTRDAGFMSSYLNDPNMPWTVDQTLDLLRGLPPTGAPGEKQEYNNSNYVVLGRVMEVVTGRPAQEVQFENITEAAGLASTLFPADSEMPQPATPGVLIVDGAERNVDLQNPSIPFTAGYAASTLADLRTWAATLTTGDLLDPATFDLQKPPPATDGLTYGMGIMDVGGWLGHNGSIPGFGTMMLRQPESGAVVVTVATGGDAINPAADVMALEAIAELYPGQFPVVDEAVAQTKAAASAAAASPAP